MTYEEKIQERNKTAEKLAEAFADLVNTFNDEEIAEHFIKGIVKSHRTLQASTVRVLLLFFNKYKDAPHDLRNQAAVEVAGVITEATKDKGVPFI